MKKAVSASFIVLILLIAGSFFISTLSASESGTIRGTIYADVDGDGRCGSGDVPVPGVNVRFKAVNSSTNVVLYTGANGTYGLPSAGLGLWRITAEPNPSRWTVTSQNPIDVRVSANNGLEQLNVNFCVKPGPGLDVSLDRLQSLPREDASDLLSVGVAAPPNPSEPITLSNSEISEALLTNPPEPTPAPNLDDEADMAVEIAPEAEWLVYLNNFRAIGGLASLQSDPALSEGSELHSRYMVLNDQPVAHNEDRNNALFTPAGQQAAKNGNIFATTQLEANYRWGVNFWISAPFHLVPILDPALTTVGYGDTNKAVGNFHMAAVLDVLTGRETAVSGVTYPLYFPADGGETWVVRHSMYEWPNPLASCPGYKRPVGAPVVLQLGDGSLSPRVTSFVLYRGSQAVESCMFNENTYVNDDPYAQKTGRTILDERDAVVIMPRNPLEVGQTYRVEITANGRTYSWSFTAVPSPESN